MQHDVNRVRRQSGFPTFISCQRQDANVLPKRRQSHQGDKLCDVSTVPLVARWPVFLARGSDADGEPHYKHARGVHLTKAPMLKLRYAAPQTIIFIFLYRLQNKFKARWFATSGKAINRKKSEELGFNL